MTQPTIIQQPGALDVASQHFLDAFAQARDYKLKREQLDMQRQDLESLMAQRAAATDESKQATKLALDRANRDLEEITRRETASRFIVSHFDSLTDNVKFGQALASAALDPKDLPYVLDERDRRMQSMRAAEESQQQAAAQAAATAGGEAVRGLAGAAAASGGLDPAVAKAVQGAPALAVPGIVQAGAALFPDQSSKLANLSNAATGLLHAGLTWGQTRRVLHMPQNGIPEDYTIEKAAGTAAAGRAAAQASGYLEIAVPMAQQIDSLINLGHGLSPAATAVRQGLQSSNAGVRAAAVATYATLPPDQQVLLNASESFAQVGRYFLSGQQSSEGERIEFLKNLTPATGDSPSVNVQKQRIRQNMIAAMKRVAGQQNPDPVGGLDEVLAAERAAGGTKSPAYQYLLQLKARASQAASQARQGKIMPDSAPTDSTNINERLNRMGSMIDSLFPSDSR